MHEFGLIIMGTELVVTVIICWFEIWAFDDALSTEQKAYLVLLYSPWMIIPGIMILDCIGSIKQKVELAEKIKVG
jgi:EXPERA (EXPanded EBP superfamily)